MKPAPFDYIAATSVEMAAACLAEAGDDAKIIAGGQSLVPLLNFRLLRPGPQSLRMNIKLPGHPGQLPVPLPLPLPDLQQHLHRAFTQLLRVLPLCRHGPESSQVWEPPKFPG